MVLKFVTVMEKRKNPPFRIGLGCGVIYIGMRIGINHFEKINMRTSFVGEGAISV